MIEHYFECPHCWQNQLKIIDPSVREQSFIEDCEVCCNPNKLSIVVSEGHITSIQIDSGNE